MEARREGGFHTNQVLHLVEPLSVVVVVAFHAVNDSGKTFYKAD